MPASIQRLPSTDASHEPSPEDNGPPKHLSEGAVAGICPEAGDEYFSQYRDDGTWQRINEVLVGAVRRLHAASEA